MGRSMAYFEAEAASMVAIIGHIAGILPAVATLAALLWYVANLYDWVQSKRKK